MRIPSFIDKQIALQNNRKLHAKIYILDFSFKILGEITGYVLDGATFSIDANSDIRRTCNITVIPNKTSIDVSSLNYIWMDKYVQIYIGTEQNIFKSYDKIYYTNMGIYLINNPTKTYDAQTNTLAISGIDIMAKMTGMRNGYLMGIEGGTTYQIPADSSIYDAMKSIVVDMGGFNKTSIIVPSEAEGTPTVPNTINASVGSTQYDLLKQLADINSFHQMYFDVDGTFYYEKIPSGTNEPIMLGDDIFQKVLINYNSNISFEEVKNVVQVYGKTLDDGTTPFAEVKEYNPYSPFYVGSIGEIGIVLSGGEYDNIFSESLAIQRAEYELYLRCRLQNQITINILPLYWLDVNWLVELTLPDKQGKEPKKEQYIIKNINTTLGTDGTQTVTMMRYFPTDV